MIPVEKRGTTGEAFATALLAGIPPRPRGNDFRCAKAVAVQSFFWQAVIATGWLCELTFVLERTWCRLRGPELAWRRTAWAGERLVKERRAMSTLHDARALQPGRGEEAICFINIGNVSIRSSTLARARTVRPFSRFHRARSRQAARAAHRQWAAIR